MSFLRSLFLILRLCSRRMSESALRLPRFLTAYRLRLTAFLGRQGWVVVILSSTVAFCVPFIQPLFYGGSDHLDNLRTAYWFLGNKEGVYIPWRPPGMALFLILTGVPWLNTWKILEISFALMSAAIPVMIYLAVQRYSRAWGMIAGLAAIISFVPYAYSRQLFAEHLFIFVHFLIIWMIAVYLSPSSRQKLVYGIAVGMFCLALIRPVVAFYYWIFLGIAIFFRRDRFKYLLRATLLYCALMSAWGLWDRCYGTGVGLILFPPETQAQKRFAETYFSALKALFKTGRTSPSIQSSDGPASQKIRQLVRQYLDKYPEAWMSGKEQHVPFELFGRYKNDPAQLVNRIFDRPNFAYFNFIRQSVQGMVGEKEKEKLLFQVAAEHGNTGVMGSICYLLQHPKKIFMGGTPSTSGRYLLASFYFSKERSHPHHRRGFSVDSGRLLWEKNGVAAHCLMESLKEYLRAFPSHWETSNDWTKPFRGRPDAMAAAIFDNINGVHEGLYSEWITRFYGFEEGDPLFTRAAIETFKSYPRSFFLFWDNFLAITLIHGWRFVKDQDEISDNLRNWGDPDCETYKNDMTVLSDGLKRELVQERFRNYFYYTWLITSRYSAFIFLAAMFFAPFAFMSPARPFVLFLLLAYFYNAAVITVFGIFGSPRYNDTYLMLLFPILCIGAHYAVRAFRSNEMIDSNLPSATNQIRP